MTARLTVIIAAAILSVQASAQTGTSLPNYLAPDARGLHRLQSLAPENDVFAPVTDRPGITQIVFRRVQSRLPAFSLAMMPDGTVHYFGEYFIERIGPHTARIEPSRFRDVADLIAAADWENIDTNFRGGNIEGPNIYIGVVMNGRLKVVELEWVGPDTPDELAEIADRIDQIRIDTEWETPASEAVIANEIATGLDHDASYVRWASADALATLGIVAHRTVAPLVATLDDPNDEVRVAVLRALAAIRWKVSDHWQRLGTLLDDDNPEIRERAADAIAASGARDPALLPLLMEAMNDEFYEVHEGAASALGNFGSDAREAVPLLMADLRHPPGHCADDAMEALAKIAPETPEFVPTLIDLLKNPGPNFSVGLHSTVRQAVLIVLREMGPQAAEAVDTIVPILSDDSAGLAQVAVKCLSEIGPPAASAVPALIDFVERRSRYGTSYAISAFPKILGASDETVQILAQFLAHPDRSVRTNALQELGNIGALNPEVFPILMAGLRSNLDDVRRFSIRALGVVGEPAERAIPSLKFFLNSRDLNIRTEAACALAELAPGDPEVREALIDLLATSTANRAAWALRDIQPPVRDAVPALESLLNNDRWDARSGAAQALLKIIPGSEKARSTLVEMLDPDNVREQMGTHYHYSILYSYRSRVSRGICRILGEHELAADEVVPALIAVANTDFYQPWIPEQLAKYGAQAAEALPLLADMAVYADSDTRDAAAMAITRIRQDMTRVPA